MKKILFTTAIISLLFAGCNKDEKHSLKTTKLSVKVGESAQIVVTPNTNGVTFTADRPRCGTISNTGLYTGQYLSFNSPIKVTVSRGTERLGVCEVEVLEGYPFKFRQPYFKGLMTLSSIIYDFTELYETRRQYVKTALSLGYEGENNYVITVIYTFSYLYGGRIMDAIGVEVPNTELSYMRNHLKERSNYYFSDDVFLEYAYREDIGGAWHGGFRSNGVSYVVTGAIQYYAPRNSWVVMFLRTEDRLNSPIASKNNGTEVIKEQYKTKIQEVAEKIFAELDNIPIKQK